MPVFEWTVNVGNLIQIGAFIVMGILFFAQIRSDISVIRYQIDNLQKEQSILNQAFKQLGDILTKVAVQDERMIALYKDIDELKHGQGYIVATKDKK